MTTENTKATTATYSEQEEQTLLAMYNPKEPNREQVAAIAEKVGKSVHSVRSKLSNLGVYVRDETPKGKKGGVNKLQIAERIAPFVGLSEVETEALAKTTLPVLNKLLAKLEPSSDK